MTGRPFRWSKALPLAALAVLVLSGCNPTAEAPTEDAHSPVAGPSGTSSTPTATTDTPTPGAEAVGPGSFDLPDPLQGLAGLSSYHATLTVTFEGTDEGQPLQWASTSDLVRMLDPSASQLTIANTGNTTQPGSTYMAEMDGTAYERSAGGDCTSNILDPARSLVAPLEPAGSLAGVMGAEALDHQVVNGVDADGYRFDERALGQAGLTRSTGEVWVASAGGHVLRYVSTSEGDSTFFGQGLAGTISVTYELTDVNVPVVVDLPRDCPVGLVAAPMLPDASNVVNEPGLLGYDTASSVTDVVAFYRGRSADLGWTASGEPTIAATGATMDYTKGDGSVTIVIATGEGGTTVHIVLNMPRE